MPTPTPATIQYITTDETSFESISADNVRPTDFEEEERTLNTIRFHAVVSEDHTATTQITKFPVQNGFEVSNHAIRKNRQIKLQGLFTNTLLAGTEQTTYGSNNSKEMFNALQKLVRSATICKVTTNLGIYNDVVFKKFHTKQEKGMVDSIMVELDGEELQIAENISKSAPVKLSFTAVTDNERQSIIDELTASSIAVDDFGNTLITDITELSSSWVEVGTDFVTESITSAGKIFDVTFVAEAWDGISEFTYDVFTENLDVFTDLDDSLVGLLGDLNLPLIPSLADLTGGLNGVTNCMLSGSSNVLVNEVEKVVDTAMGVLDKSIYGAKQDIIKLGGNDAMQSLIGTGLDCIALGASKTLGGEATSVDTAVDEAIVAIKGIGNAATSIAGSVVDGATKTLTRVIKIESPAVLPLENSGGLN